MGKRFKRILAIVLAVCFILSEWGGYGYAVNAAENGLTISGASTISTIQKGSAWTCKGTISSNNIIKEVKGTIYESDGLTVIYRKIVYPNSVSYTIQNGEIDKALLFNKLQAGTYYYAIDAKDASGAKKTLVNNKFTVQGTGGSVLKITGVSTLSSLEQGNSWTCSGTVSSNYVLKEVRGTIYEGDGIKVKYQKSVYPNNKSYKLQNGEIDRALLFNNLSSGTYYYTIVASDVSGRTLTLVRNEFTVQGQSVEASTLKITGASTISSLQQGSSWTCKGTVSSNYALKEFRGTIYESDGITVKYRKSVYPNGKSYDIQKDRKIGETLLFSSLPAGTYHYTIVARDASGEKEKTLVNNKFTVQAVASTLKITGASKISSLKQGDSWICKGTVSSNYVLKEVRGTIYESNGITVKNRKSVYPNSKDYNIQQDGKIGKALLFNKLPVGTYHYTIVARDASGTEKTLVNNKFTVQAKPSAIKIIGASRIKSLQEGDSWTCKGTVVSGCMLKEIRGTIYESDGITIKYRKSVFPNSKIYSIESSGDIGRELMFHKLPAGTYHYTIVAKDILGTEKTLFNDKFVVNSALLVLDNGYYCLKDYRKYSGKNSKYDQKNAIYSGDFNENGCMAVSYAVLWSLIDGQSRDPLKFWTGAQAICNGYGKSKLKDEAYNRSVIYKKIKSGVPVMINMKHGGYNHFVVAVGIKSTATEKTISDQDILVIDPFFGAVRNLTKCPYSGNNCYSGKSNDFKKNILHTLIF